MPSSDALLEMLTEAARSLNRHRDLDELLHAIVDLCLEAVGADVCFVYLYEFGDLVLRASSNAHPEEVGRLRMRIGEGITGWVAQQRRPVALAEKAMLDARFKFYSALPEDRFEAFLSVPILFRNNVLGVVNMQHRDVYTHTAAELKAVQALGFMLGEALERSGEAAARQRLERRYAPLADFQRWLLRDEGERWLEACAKIGAAVEARAVTLALRGGADRRDFVWAAPGDTPLAALEKSLPAGEAQMPDGVDAPAQVGKTAWLLPLRVGENLLGSLHLGFAQAERADVALMGLLAGLLAAAIAREDLRVLAGQQAEALTERKLVERAKGLLQQERQLSEADAYRLLQQESRRSRRSMAAVAQALLTSHELEAGTPPRLP